MRGQASGDVSVWTLAVMSAAGRKMRSLGPSARQIPSLLSTPVNKSPETLAGCGQPREHVTERVHMRVCSRVSGESLPPCQRGLRLRVCLFVCVFVRTRGLLVHSCEAAWGSRCSRLRLAVAICVCVKRHGVSYCLQMA